MFNKTALLPLAEVRPINDCVTLLNNAPAKLVGEVKWYDPDRGFGFITHLEGEHKVDIFVHVSEMYQSEITFLALGQKVEFRICFKQDNSKYATDLKLLTGPKELFKNHIKDDYEKLLKGRVVHFNSFKGYGHISRDDGEHAVYIHINVIKKCGIPEHKIKNHRVRFSVGLGEKPGTTQAVYVELA